MRWLLIGFLVSLAALLIAGAGMVRHIRVQHKRTKSRHATGTAMAADPNGNSLLEAGDETDTEAKI